ncbi:MAG: hypothetical protein V2I67_06180 [Thermoanaerobaculales bacterium]|jgi:hypothetical protein|nr:hypothetical protein [Thermoanaerobaculales bacterium]
MRPSTDPVLRRAATMAAVAVAMAASGCATSPRVSVDPIRMAEARAAFDEPLPGELAALYRVRMPRSGSLRLAVITDGASGRWTISEPFGSAVSMTAWNDSDDTLLYDMEVGCRRPVQDLREVVGIDAFPMTQAARLLAGRLPAASGDRVVVTGAGEFEVHGDGWGVAVCVAADPWRVVEVRPLRGRWRITLEEHKGPVPGRIRVKAGRGRWAELELSRIEWPEEVSLPALPDFPACVAR